MATGSSAHPRQVAVRQDEAAGEGRLIDVHLQLHLHPTRQLLQSLIQRLKGQVQNSGMVQGVVVSALHPARLRARLRQS